MHDIFLSILICLQFIHHNNHHHHHHHQHHQHHQISNRIAHDLRPSKKKTYSYPLNTLVALQHYIYRYV